MCTVRFIKYVLYGLYLVVLFHMPHYIDLLLPFLWVQCSHSVAFGKNHLSCTIVFKATATIWPLPPQ